MYSLSRKQKKVLITTETTFTRSSFVAFRLEINLAHQKHCALSTDEELFCIHSPMNYPKGCNSIATFFTTNSQPVVTYYTMIKWLI